MDRTDKDARGDDLFKFKLRRKDFVLSKTTEEITVLRNKLTIIYRGVSFIPEL
jgi:hypothetical protein